MNPGQHVEVVDHFLQGERAIVTANPQSGNHEQFDSNRKRAVWVVFDRENDSSLERFKQRAMLPGWFEISRLKIVREGTRASLARNAGLNMRLTTQEEIERARLLEQSNEHKYEVANISPSRRETNETWFYFYAQSPETQEIVSWVQSGQGEQPSHELQGILSKH